MRRWIEEKEGQRRRSKVEVYLHLVWATEGRVDRVTPDWEGPVYRCIRAEAARLRCSVLALNGMPDHVHLAVRTAGIVSPADLAKQVKGVSSALLNDLRPEFSELFRWQPGYACFSLGRNQIAAVVAYVDHQKQHHGAGTLWPAWEETDEAADEPAPGPDAVG
jgi:REP element-mobilizing transposase RayT